MPIQLLPPEVASQIAAGEVVERPASVVKELLENSLDSGATFISLNIEGAGRRLVEVADDGCGIPADELAIAVERHATSKLSKAEDLFHIKTLGFRGEALASIGSVSRMTIQSRNIDGQAGGRLRIEGGRAERIEWVAAPIGTIVRVEDLFFNVPARLKFLKSEITERHHIETLVARYALSYPEVRFHLHQDGKLVLQTSGNGDRREILAALFGVEIARQMLEVLAKADGLRINGYISPISVTRSNRREITFFVNGRPIHDVALSTALVQAYHTMLMVGRYPLAILFLELVPEDVDVNVHPTKAEVRFRDANRVFSSVQNAVRRALMAHTPVPGIQIPQTWESLVDRDPHSPDRSWQTYVSPGSPAGSPLSLPIEQPEVSQLTPQGAQLPYSSGTRTPILRLIGQVASTYLVAEGPDGLYLIDQHAAHERVLFEEFMKQRNSLIPSQDLLQPAVVDLPAGTFGLLSAHLPLLEELGFRLEPFGPNSYLVRSTPVLLSSMDPAAAVRVIVEDFEEDETPLQSEIEAKIIARICKRAAIKGGQSLSTEEQQALLSGLEACQSPRTCPHGRPTMIHLSVDLLERQFGRKGAR